MQEEDTSSSSQDSIAGTTDSIGLPSHFNRCRVRLEECDTCLMYLALTLVFELKPYVKQSIPRSRGWPTT